MADNVKNDGRLMVYAAAFCTVAAWGASFASAKVALQQTSAYWIDRLKSAKAEAAAAIAASEAEKSAQKSLAELRLADGSDAAANELRKAHAEEMAAAAMRAERELQATSAFWVARLQAAKAAKKK